ncbi:hypothetical protein P3H15_47435 [Rhodococcus sp. T2V]|uniref:hypothetical protein n=1 Tax=Rhodococcus sp. T2V TaxID=3034164 RepID=UPI0023E27401|nr:hypothetical protein [Rhodococcus sp. T2V]MDF3312583.1 hypothetical protein [Rhodococcus sp. T2V]
MWKRRPDKPHIVGAVLHHDATGNDHPGPGVHHTRRTTPPPETTTDAPVEPVNEEPHIVECLEGTPGPARFSDGTLAFSQ